MWKEVTRRNFLRNLIAISGTIGSGWNLHGVAFGQTQKVNLKYTTWAPPLSPDMKSVWGPLFEEIKKRSADGITYTFYAGGALGKATEQYDLVANGVADIGYFNATFSPGRFPLTDVLSMSAGIDDKETATEIAKPVYDRFLHREFQDVKVLELNGCFTGYLWTRKPIHALEDIKGLRIRTPGGFQTRYTKALGAETVFTPPGDIYMSLQTGVVDGVVTCPMAMQVFRLAEVVKYGTLIPFGCTSEGLIMNKKVWEKLPENYKRLMTEMTQNPYRTTKGLRKEAYASMMKGIGDKGVILSELRSEETERWFEKFRDVTREWVADLERKGLPAKEVVKIYNEECEKRGVRFGAFPRQWK